MKVIHSLSLVWEEVMSQVGRGAETRSESKRHLPSIKGLHYLHLRKGILDDSSLSSSPRDTANHSLCTLRIHPSPALAPQLHSRLPLTQAILCSGAVQ